MRFGIRKRGIAMVVVLAAMVFAGAAHAQTTTTSETKSFEILSVDGNLLVIREAGGTRELIVPSDFRFNVDGKSLAVTELKPGMKGTAKVTKTTVQHPVYVTEVRNATVVKTMGETVIVQNAAGDFKMFSQSEVDQQGIHVFMDGKILKLQDMQVGDKISANFVTMGPPQTMTKTQVDVELAKAAAAPKAAPTGGSATTVTTTETTPTDTTVEAPVEVTPAPADTAATAAAPASSSMLLWLGLIFVVLVIVLVLRRRAKS